MKKTQRVIAALIALILVFNIGIINAMALPSVAVNGLVDLGVNLISSTGDAFVRTLFPDKGPSTVAQNYYTIYSPNSNGIGGMYTGAPSYYHALDVDNSKVTTYNTTTNNYVTNTVNRITYNQTNNTYYATTNNTNYFITYRPTYVNVTYIMNGATSIDDAVSYNLYYQLPDGRNSYDLTANDVFGQVMLSDFVNYKQVVEDDGRTLQLMHFDGNILNSSASGLGAAYGEGASLTYVDTGSFNKASYWASDVKTFLSIGAQGVGAGDFTLEMRLKLGNLQYSQSSLVGTTLPGDTYTDLRLLWHGGSAANHYQAIFENMMLITDQSILYTDATSAGRYTGSSTKYDGNWFLNRAKINPASWGAFKTTSNGHDINDYTLYSYDTAFDSANSVPALSKNVWVHFAIVRNNGIVYYYYNGNLVGSTSNNTNIQAIGIVRYANKYDLFIDELRITKQALYTSNFTPSSMPYDTNKVLVLPETGAENRIAVKSNLAINGTRIGGVRPTYPTTGYVYISLDDDNKVESIQQYNGSDWTPVDGAIYKGGTWKNLDKYDFSSFIVTEPEPDQTNATPLGNVNVTYILKNVTVPDSVNYVKKNGSLSLSVVPDEGYSMPETIGVYMDNELLIAGTDYSYSNGQLSLSSVTGDVYISIVADADGSGTTPTHGVSYLLTNLNLVSQTRSENNVTATLGISSGYKLPEKVTVSVGGNIIQPGTAYSYNNGVVTVPNVTGDVVITATATIDAGALPSPTPGPSPTPKPGGDDGEDDGLHSFWSFLEDILNFIIDGIGSLLSTVTNLLSTLQNFGTGFVNFLSASLGFIPPEITTLLALGVGLMIAAAVIKMFKG